MSELKELLSVVDSGWAAIALLILALAYLLDKHGGRLLALAAENLEVSKSNAEVAEAARSDAAVAREKAEQISHDIITNHGSKNLGDAIDRLTEWVAALKLQSESTREVVDKLGEGQETLYYKQVETDNLLQQHIEENLAVVEFTRGLMKKALNTHLEDS